MNNQSLQDALTAWKASPVITADSNTLTSWEPQRLTHTKPFLSEQGIALILQPHLRHKFIIFGVEYYSKDQILDACIAACNTDILLPLSYVLENPRKATFIAKCSVAVIKQLVNQGLIINMPDGRTLGMDIVLGYAHMRDLSVKPQREINEALKYRYDLTKKILNLDDFRNDKALQCIYCTLSAPRILFFVVTCCTSFTADPIRRSKLSVRKLSLRSNRLTDLSPLDNCFNYHLTSIDLRNNEIDSVKRLNYFKDCKITELWLDRNPVCSLYTTREEYVKAVQSVFPHVQRLDGVLIGVKTKFVPPILTNYLADDSRISLIKQFIQHFFTYYDQNDRNVMNGLYDQDALYSITLGPITNTTHLQMTKAFANNRNLLKFVDYAKCHEFLLCGPEKIIAALRRQPATYHDYKSFNVDLLHYTDESITIAVQGSFCYKEYPYPPLLFNRTFVIVELEDNEYCIANDQYHIQSELSDTKSTMNEAKTKPVAVPRIEPTIFSSTEKEQLLKFLGVRTTMNETFCRRYLDKANWDIRVALSTFVKAYTVNDIPPEAFKE